MSQINKHTAQQMKSKQIVRVLNDIAKRYPGEEMQVVQRRDITRIGFHISLVLQALRHRYVSDFEIVDIGGGLDFSR